MSDEFEGDEGQLAAKMHKAVAALDVAKVRSLLASGVPADTWDLTGDYDLPLKAVSCRDGDDALSIVNCQGPG